MEPVREAVRKELTCPGCGEKALVRVAPGQPEHRWHCPSCHKLQTSDAASVEAAPVSA
jgi:ribosomal protein L37AE/L43A